MNTKIILSLVVIFAVSAIAVGGTVAYFSDTETSTGNTFTAGSLDLVLAPGTPLPFSVSNLVPGQTGTGKVTLTNATGSIDGDLDVKLANLVENENGCVAPETAAGDPDCSAGAGDLGLDSFQIAVFVDVNKDGIWNLGDIKLAYGGQVIPYAEQNYLSYSSPRNTLDGWNDIMAMTAGQSVDLVINWQVKSTWGYSNYNQNIIMTDSLGFDVQTSLEQVGGSGGVTE